MSGRRSVLDESYVTIPNIMSGARVAIAFTAAALFALGRHEGSAVVLCAAGVVLDAVDGWYARRFSQVSRLGRFLDPLADKCLMAVVYGVIAFKMHSLPVWVLFAVITGRDLIITASRTLQMQRHGVAYAADGVGKLKMIVQSTAGIGILAYAFLLRDDFNFSPYPIIIILLIITLLSYVSAGRYLLSRGVR